MKSEILKLTKIREKVLSLVNGGLKARGFLGAESTLETLSKDSGVRMESCLAL